MRYGIAVVTALIVGTGTALLVLTPAKVPPAPVEDDIAFCLKSNPSDFRPAQNATQAEVEEKLEQATAAGERCRRAMQKLQRAIERNQTT